PVLGVVAPSGSGKTTLIQTLVGHLRAAGLRLGYLKHAHHRFDLDTPGKDSYEVRKAGVEQVVLASRQRWALLVENPPDLDEPDLCAMLGRFDAEGLDLVLVEGFKHACYPKIEVWRAACGEAPLYPHDPDILAVASDAAAPDGAHPTWLDLNDVEAVARFVRDWLAAQPPRPESAVLAPARRQRSEQ
ncbi:MAG: molybdopterin-guanine dinucleotide biosynthesis protein B, partial [Chromatiaceae bacterium]|nr:molybdopterin-guanine dinucleotide biosynthesis protein B [Chromatiaceae bacterium]